MGEQRLVACGGESRFGGADLRALMHDTPGADDLSGLDGDRVDQVELRLQGGVAGSDGERAVDGGAHGAVEQGGCEPCMDDADRVVVLFPGMGGE